MNCPTNELGWKYLPSLCGWTSHSLLATDRQAFFPLFIDWATQGQPSIDAQQREQVSCIMARDSHCPGRDISIPNVYVYQLRESFRDMFC